MTARLVLHVPSPRGKNENNYGDYQQGDLEDFRSKRSLNVEERPRPPTPIADNYAIARETTPLWLM